MSYRWTIPQSRRPANRPNLGRAHRNALAAGSGELIFYSSDSPIASSDAVGAGRLALRVLRAAAGLSQADLLPLDFARVASDEAGLTERLAQALVVVHQRARDPVTNRAGLAGGAAAADGDVHIELALGFRDRERLAH